jgi:hypothetical protein
LLNKKKNHLKANPQRENYFPARKSLGKRIFLSRHFSAVIWPSSDKKKKKKKTMHDVTPKIKAYQTGLLLIL